MDVTWENVSKASNTRSARLDDALAQAETLHKAVNMLLKWLSDAEMKLRFAGALPDEEPETLQQLADHHKYIPNYYIINFIENSFIVECLLLDFWKR